jgi:hypothetical protein
VSDVARPGQPPREGRRGWRTQVIVSRLIELLQDCDPEAEVRIMMQQSWPFENAIDGIATREDMVDEEEHECDCVGWPHDADCEHSGEREYRDGMAANDVFIVEGRQERYGSKNAWAVSRR